MCKEELNQENELDEGMEAYSEVEEQLEILGLNEEIKRIELQDNPTSEVSEETKNSDFYKENMAITETLGAMFQKLIGFGIDYNNALSFSSIILQNDATLKQQKMVQVVQEQNQP
jgi:hypothetical protein